jgi:hypothetical protein
VNAIEFIETTLIDPETDKPFVLTDLERLFLQHAFQIKPNGRLAYPELLFSAPKKSGKTAFAAMVLIYIVVALIKRGGEGIIVANDFEQAKSRVFAAAKRIVEASPALKEDAVISKDCITFQTSSGVIIAIASDFAGAAGANPHCVVFDELWGYVYEKAHRLWDELVPSPARKISARLTVSYAGFLGESVLLETLQSRGYQGEQIAPDLYAQPGMLMLWTHSFSAPWQDEAWREEMRRTSRPQAFIRQIENRFVSGESVFIDMNWWDQCTDPAAKPIFTDRCLPIWVGVDASYKRDSTAIVACTWDRRLNKVRLVWHRVIYPCAANPLSFEDDIEQALYELRKRFNVREVRYDPYQMVSTAERLKKYGLPMLEFKQTVQNLTRASQNLYDLLKDNAIVVYPDPDARLQIQRAVAIEQPDGKGWKISKDKSSHKVDFAVALAQAALGAVQGGIGNAPVDLDALESAARQMGSSRYADVHRPGYGRQANVVGYSMREALARPLGSVDAYVRASGDTGSSGSPNQLRPGRAAFYVSGRVSPGVPR